MDQDPPNTAAGPPGDLSPTAVAPEPPTDEPPRAENQPIAQLFGVPVIIWALIVFVIIIAVLAWFDLVGGDLM